MFEAFDKSIAALLLSTVFLGFDLSLQPQHGHQDPFQLMNISHIAHLFCPAEYLPEPSAGLRALCCSHLPLHVINQTSQPNKSTSKNSKMTIYFGLTLIVENTVDICGISCHHAIPVCSSFSTCSCFSMSLRISIT